MYIKNYVLIEELSITFDAGYHVITGETGAGKSIILDAFALALGERFDKKAVLNEAEKCVIEIEFDVQNNKKVSFVLEELGLDILPTLTLRRELTLPNRMRSFVNDTPCTLEQIQKLAVHLVDLHRQFDHMNLLHPFFEIEMIDSMNNATDTREAYAILHHKINQLRRREKDIEDLIAKGEKDNAYYSHLFQEIEDMAIKDGELQQLEIEGKKLEHADQVLAQLSRISGVIEENEVSIVGEMSSLHKALIPYQALHDEIRSLADRLDAVRIELKDIANTALDIRQHFDVDNEQLDKIQERLSSIYTLMKKHQFQHVEQLLAYREEVQKKIMEQSSYAEELQQVRIEMDSLQKQAHALAYQLSQARVKTIAHLEKDMNMLLVEVGMPIAKWKVQQITLEQANAYGIDQIDFLIDVNGVGIFSPVAKVASGGELSRIMLCLKTILSRYTDLPVMVFDEIDVGISGEVTKKIGKLLAELGETKQILCITHQPSVTATAKHHFYVYKLPIEGNMKTSIKRLSQEERVRVIASMLDGENPSETSLRHAKEMLLGKN